jgi:hypothetical protein
MQSADQLSCFGSVHDLRFVGRGGNTTDGDDTGDDEIGGVWRGIWRVGTVGL